MADLKRSAIFMVCRIDIQSAKKGQIVCSVE